MCTQWNLRQCTQFRISVWLGLKYSVRDWVRMISLSYTQVTITTNGSAWVVSARNGVRNVPRYSREFGAWPSSTVCDRFCAGLKLERMLRTNRRGEATALSLSIFENSECLSRRLLPPQPVISAGHELPIRHRLSTESLKHATAPRKACV
jgi:hypothetical protein